MARQNIDLIPYDFETHAKSLIEYLRVNLPNDYQDFLESNAARTLIDAIAYELSLLAFMVNANVKQLFIPTATTRRAMYVLGKLVNYDLQGKVPSDTVVTFFLNKPHTEDIIIAEGSQVQASGTPPIIFETTIAVTLQAGQSSVSVSAKQGMVKNESIGTTSPLSAPYQQFVSSTAPLAETFTLEINDIAWTQVDNLFDLAPGQLGYTISPDEDGLAIVSFGNGIFGAIPPPNKDVEVRYRVGGGTNTNVVSGSITELLSSVQDVHGGIVPLRVTNSVPSSGGQDEESIEEARIKIPRSVRSMDRFVSREDFQKIPQLFEDANVGKIFKSSATVRYLWSVHIITIYALGNPRVGRFQPPTIPTQALVEALRSYVEARTFPTIAIAVEPARLYTVNITGRVYFLPNYREDVVRENVLNALDSRVFDNTVREIGDGLRLSDVYAAIDDAGGVDYCILTTPVGNINVLGDEYIAPGTIDLIFYRVSRA